MSKTKLHEVLAAEKTVVGAADKMLAETASKFGHHSQFFSGSLRVLKRLGSTPEDEAAEKAGKVDKPITTSVKQTLDYALPFFTKAMQLRLVKHTTNQVAKSDITLGGKVVMKDVPVDFLLDLEAELPKMRALFLTMPTLDPSKRWKSEGRPGVVVTDAPVQSTQTTKVMVPVLLAPSTDKHPAQVKESTEERVVGLYSDTFFSGCATTEQKALAIELCDRLIVEVKQARMRANSVEVVAPSTGAATFTQLFEDIFK
jgi:hypothetical protein